MSATVYYQFQPRSNVVIAIAVTSIGRFCIDVKGASVIRRVVRERLLSPSQSGVTVNSCDYGADSRPRWATVRSNEQVGGQMNSWVAFYDI